MGNIDIPLCCIVAVARELQHFRYGFGRFGRVAFVNPWRGSGATHLIKRTDVSLR